MTTRDKIIYVQKEARKALTEWLKLSSIQEERDI